MRIQLESGRFTKTSLATRVPIENEIGSSANRRSTCRPLPVRSSKTSPCCSTRQQLALASSPESDLEELRQPIQSRITLLITHQTGDLTMAIDDLLSNPW